MLDIVGRGYNHGNESYGAGDRAIRPNDGYPFNQETLKPPEVVLQFLLKKSWLY